MKTALILVLQTCFTICSTVSVTAGIADSTDQNNKLIKEIYSLCL